MNKFKVAFRGLFLSFRHRAVKIQIFNAILAIIAGIILKLNYIEWTIFVILIGLVISLELINTCIELICDFIEPKYNERIKDIKDISSGAVLMISICALVIAIVIFIHKLGGF